MARMNPNNQFVIETEYGDHILQAVITPQQAANLLRDEPLIGLATGTLKSYQLNDTTDVVYIDATNLLRN